MSSLAQPCTDEAGLALRRYGVLDTPREPAYDLLVELVGTICAVPVAMVELFDADRCFFKAEIGLGLTELPAEALPWRRLSSEDDFVEIPDACWDDRFAEAPSCPATGRPVRFYAGAPLRTKEGLLIGTLCVLDYQARKLSVLQQNAIRSAANLVMQQLESGRALRDQELLRRESEHRVKNSLANAAALLRAQARKTANAEVEVALTEASSRILSASMLHQQMQAAEADQLVDLQPLMETIGSHLGQSAPEAVTIEVAVAPRTVPFATAASIMSITTEFVLNSFKHGFPTGRRGTVRIEGFDDDGTLVVEGFDDGVGCDAPVHDKAPDTSTGLGQFLMRASADRVGAELETAVDPDGAWFVFRLPATESSSDDAR